MKKILRTFWLRLRSSLRFSLLLVVSFFLTRFSPEFLGAHLGIVARSQSGLWGILGHPLLHFSAAHLWANVGGVLTLGTMVAMDSPAIFVRVTATAWILGGALVWIISPAHTLTGGASGIVFAYLGYLITQGIFRKRFLALVLSVTVVYFFNSTLLGMLPLESGVSWQGHLAGFVCGILVAATQQKQTA